MNCLTNPIRFRFDPQKFSDKQFVSFPIFINFGLNSFSFRSSSSSIILGFAEEINANSSSGNLISWKSSQSTYVSLWYRMKKRGVAMDSGEQGISSFHKLLRKVQNRLVGGRAGCNNQREVRQREEGRQGN